MIKPMEPIIIVDWDRVTHVRVTLEEAWRGGGLRWRQGTTEPRQNFSFNPHDPDSDGPWYSGMPIMYPESGPAIAGDPERDSFIMPANVAARIQSRSGEIIPDVRQHAAFIAFGYFMAPLTEGKRGVVGFTQSNERPRIASFWHWYEMPNIPDDRKNMSRIGPPAVPKVAIRPLNQSMLPLKHEGEEIVIRPFSFWKFDDAALYEPIPPGHIPPRKVGSPSSASLLESLAPEEIEALREMLKGRVAVAKSK